MNEHLIIFFGQYRNFDYIVPQLNLNGFDVIASTWNMKYSGVGAGAAGDWREPITETDILKYIPNAKVKLWDYEFSELAFKFRNTANMLFHFKAGLSMIDEGKMYKSITLHRFDLFSDIHKIQEMDLGDSLYCDTTGEFEGGNGSDGVLRLQDWMFFGKQHIIKRYVDSFEYDFVVSPEAHKVQGDHILNNNISRTPIVGSGINYTLCKDFTQDGYSLLFDKYNKIGFKYFNSENDSELSKQFKSDITKIW